MTTSTSSANLTHTLISKQMIRIQPWNSYVKSVRREDSRYPDSLPTLILVEHLSTGSIERLNQLSNLYVHGLEQIVVFPCGHGFGDRCVREEYLEQRDLACSCGFRMAYTNCGYAIAPVMIPASCAGSIRDTFSFTIPEGGQTPSHCKECRWVTIQAKLRYALNPECVICARRARAGVALRLENPIEHDGHRRQHVTTGLWTC